MHVPLRHPSVTYIEIVALVCQLNVLHEPTFHDIEALVRVFDSNLVQNVKEFPGEEIDDAVAQPFSMFQFRQVFFLKR
jgi:hypothetical protein